MTAAASSNTTRVDTESRLQRRARRRRWLDRAADTAFTLVLLAALALALGPLVVNLLRSDVRAAVHAVQAEEAWAADRSAGVATATLLGRPVADNDESPAVDRTGQAFAGLR